MHRFRRVSLICMCNVTHTATHCNTLQHRWNTSHLHYMIQTCIPHMYVQHYSSLYVRICDMKIRWRGAVVPRMHRFRRVSIICVCDITHCSKFVCVTGWNANATAVVQRTHQFRLVSLICVYNNTHCNICMRDRLVCECGCSCAQNSRIQTWIANGVATIGRLLQSIGLFCRISSLL